jgi:hypothetical protein
MGPALAMRLRKKESSSVLQATPHEKANAEE